ncbi:MAG: PilN domain-containing protein [Thiobacillaceae bacterium]
MRRVQLDYQRNMRPIPWLGWGVLVASLAGLALVGTHALALDQRLAVWETKAERIEHLASLRAHVPPPETVQSAREQILEVDHANQVLRELTLPWSAMFRAVESSSGKTVTLLSMEPNVQKGTLKISGEARNIAAMLDYVRQLGQREVFSTVYLQNHQVRQDDPEKPVRFSLLAAWKVASP